MCFLLAVLQAISANGSSLQAEGFNLNLAGKCMPWGSKAGPFKIACNSSRACCICYTTLNPRSSSLKAHNCNAIETRSMRPRQAQATAAGVERLQSQKVNMLLLPL